jgi:hypothetical protein
MEREKERKDNRRKGKTKEKETKSNENKYAVKRSYESTKHENINA